MDEDESSQGGIDAETKSAAPNFHHTIHGLLDAHKSIERTAEDIPGGVRTVTTSKDKQVAKMIQLHVEQMAARMKDGRPVRMWDPLFREMFAQREHVNMAVKPRVDGVEVTVTSKKNRVVGLIRQHAHRGVSEFVRDGYDRAHKPTPLPDE